MFVINLYCLIVNILNDCHSAHACINTGLLDLNIYIILI